MSKRKEHFLLRINALIVAMTGLLGCGSCSYYVKYGVPDFPLDDSTVIDTTMHCMYGVTPIMVKYGAPGTFAPERIPAPEPESERDIPSENPSEGK